MEELKKAGMEHVLVVCGGIIPTQVLADGDKRGAGSACTPSIVCFSSGLLACPVCDRVLGKEEGHVCSTAVHQRLPM